MEPYSFELEKRETNPEPRLGWMYLALFIAFYVALMFAVFFLAQPVLDLFSNGSLRASDVFAGANSLYLDALAFLIAFLIIRPVRRFLLPAFNLSVLKRGRTYLDIVLFFIAILIMQLITIGVLGIENNSQQEEDLGTANAITLIQQLVFFIAVAIVTPIKEEMIFRGLLYRFFTKKINVIVGLILSSIIFGMLHGGLAITASLMGLFIALLYKKTNSIYPPILLHMLWNTFASVGVFF